jgi:CDP-diacylglycerol---glycerol-3-phosphate 3-phosphatidyltransferase
LGRVDPVGGGSDGLGGWIFCAAERASDHTWDFAAFISLVDMHLAKAWMVVIIIGRELVILGLRNIASAEGFTIAASTLGKTKMVLQVCAAAVLIYGARHPSFRTLGLVLLWLVVISAVVSAAQYFYRFWNQLDDRVKERRKLSVLEVHKKSQDAMPL